MEDITITVGSIRNEEGVFLYFGNIRVKIAETGGEFQKFINGLQNMRNIFKKNLELEEGD